MNRLLSIVSTYDRCLTVYEKQNLDAMFKKLKHIFTSVSMLQSFNSDKYMILKTNTSCIKHGQRPCFRSLPKGMETCYAGEISMYTERENRIQVATLEKTQLIAKDFSELRIHFWPDVWPFMVGL
ncbi:conserved hypothetical protein [Histoplasma mississippiense (nom. inval.)]|uniref:conserved hypothetical protein n=1 Tax=Ajellomyces capsulatus (strain NAm1 / WU24) TaxID=2059318 RepID=UPI000157D554|nr:conserved hypothetical protein [Histoplasma mississippiense (nom. inval.)]EDN05421.1 conserved hypothetical protein [Histoplasma mississippiense (nom. inval.)]